MALDIHERFDRGSRRAPGRKVRKLTIIDVPSYQQTSCPQTMIFFVEFCCIKVGEFEIAPIMQNAAPSYLPLLTSTANPMARASW
jgi:hypothetical protein